jgi:hypothetical protein
VACCVTLAVDAEKLLESDAAPETEQTELDSGDELANENQEKTPYFRLAY